MLRDPDQPDVGWEDSEKELGDNPERPFYAPGKTLLQQRYNAEQRCQKIGRYAVEHPDVAGGQYFTCEEES